MSLLQFHDFFQILSDGVRSWEDLDNEPLSSKQIFVQAGLAFNNEDIVVDLPDEAYDLEYIHLLDPNDETRMRFDRDCELPILCFQLLV